MDVEDLTRETILEKVISTITQERVGVHGAPENSFSDIAQLWNWYLGDRLKDPLEPFEVCIMLSMLKLARLKTTPAHEDNFVDAIGYMAIAAELFGQTLSESAQEFSLNIFVNDVELRKSQPPAAGSTAAATQEYPESWPDDRLA